MSIEEILDKIISKPDLHARWLNTLSFLEHVGTRKIHKTQSRPDMTDLIIQHASEEARHAHFFKRMADRIDPKNVKDYRFSSMLCGYAAYRYFQGLDSMVEKKVWRQRQTKKADPFLCYLYVTTLVEERAGWLYPIYEKRLREMKSDITLASVIQEEERHLADMYRTMGEVEPTWEETMKEFRDEEEKLYQKFFMKLVSEVNSD